MKRIQFFITGLSSGGAERQLTGLATLLKKKGYVVQVCWYTNINFYEHVLRDNGIDFRCLYTSNHIKKVLNIFHAIKEFKPDYVVSFLDGPNTITPYLKAVTFGKYKLVVSERNTTQKIDWRSRLRFWGYRFADYIVPNSGSQARFISKHYPKYDRKVVTITNFTDLQKFHPSSHFENKPLRGMVAARITDAKNTKRFINAVYLAHLQGAEIDVTWFGNSFNSKYSEECSALVKEKCMDEYFHLQPATKDIVKEYEKSDVVILPSHFEGCPNVICEAISCGLPVLCSDVCDNSVLVQNEVNGFLFNQMSEHDMANKILAFCNLSDKCRRIMGEKSRVLAEKLLSKELFLQKYIDLFS